MTDPWPTGTETVDDLRGSIASIKARCEERIAEAVAAERERRMTGADVPPLAAEAREAADELKNTIWRIAGGPGPRGSGALTLAQVEEIAAEAHDYAQGMAADEREQIAKLLDQNHAHYDCDPDYGKPAADLLRKQP